MLFRKINKFVWTVLYNNNYRAVTSASLNSLSIVRHFHDED